MTAPSFFVLGPMVRRLQRGSPLGTAACDALFALPFERATLRSGAYLVREGDRSNTCMLLLSGFAYRSKMTSSGARQILSIHVRGDLVNLQNSLLDLSDHNVQALTIADVAMIPTSAILQLAAAHSSIARALWRDTLIDAAIFRQWLLNVGRRDARQRIAHLFCELAVRQEAAGLCDGPRFQWPMTQEQIGDATGLTPVHVNWTVQALRRDGLIGHGGPTVTIEDWAGLCAAGDFDQAYLHQPADVRTARSAMA